MARGNALLTGFATVTAVAGLMTWFGISVTYVRFYQGFKVQGFDRKTLPYAHVLQPYAAWYSIVMCLVICFVSLSLRSSLSLSSHAYHTVLGLVRVPQGPVGGRHIRDKLPSFDPLPHPLHRRAHLEAHRIRAPTGNGL